MAAGDNQPDPTSATARMRIWRALKALGCAALRDGADMLPFAEAQKDQLRKVADETVREGGKAWRSHSTSAEAFVPEASGF